MKADKIQHWLNTVEHNENNNDQQLSPTAKPDRPAKRRRLDLVTPPSSNNNGNAPPTMASPHRRDGSKSPSKRSLDHETPRAQRRQISLRSYPSLSSASSDRQSASALSSRRSSRTPSPRKQLRQLQLEPRGLDLRQLSAFGSMPPALEALLDDLGDFADGRGIVARDVETALRDVAATDKRFKWATRQGGGGGSGDYLSSDEGLKGRTPPPRLVLKVMRAAAECSLRGHPEANWNLKVHQLVLDMAFYTEDKPDAENVIDFMGCTTASILREYGIATSSKKVDFCIYIDPEKDAAAASSHVYNSAAARGRDMMPERTLNFTDFAPLYDRFIALSIETKRPSENIEAATLQLGVWEMARWSFLRRLLSLRQADYADTTGLTGSTVTLDVAARAESMETAATAATRLPDFLPAVFIQGHYWYLAITTTEGQKTVLWLEVPIGNTLSSRSVYQIVRSLQRLGSWARDTHWPWLRAMIEGVRGLEGEEEQDEDMNI